MNVAHNPGSTVAPTAQTGAGPGPHQGQQTTILLVEDEDRLLLGLAAVMRRAGYAVLTASNGAAGLQQARERRPDLIICDVMMPPPDGFELRSILASDPATASVPFIFLTARTGLQDKLRGIEGGADDYITKPFERQELLARVQAVLRRNELGRQKGLAEAEVKVDRLRSRVMSGVSQEMRKPVASLLETLRNMLGDRFADNPQRLGDLVEVATDSAHRLESITEDLVTLVTLDDGSDGLLRAPVDLDTAFHEPIEQCLDHWRRFEMRDLDANIEVAPGTSVHAQDQLLARAVFHLVDNACKFSPEGGQVSIRLAANGAGGCVLTVSDQGPGIPEELGEQAFNRFVQGTAGVERMYGGLGLGLTIARAAARSFDGEVEQVDTPNGCTMRLVLPPADVPLDGPARLFGPDEH